MPSQPLLLFISFCLLDNKFGGNSSSFFFFFSNSATNLCDERLGFFNMEKSVLSGMVSPKSIVEIPFQLYISFVPSAGGLSEPGSRETYLMS